MAAMTATTGAISPYGTAARANRAHENGRRRRDTRGSVSTAGAALCGTGLLDTEVRVPGRHSSYWFKVNVMFSLATSAACLIVDFPVRIRASMVRRMLPFSTFTQFFAV